MIAHSAVPALRMAARLGDYSALAAALGNPGQAIYASIAMQAEGLLGDSHQLLASDRQDDDRGWELKRLTANDILRCDRKQGSLLYVEGKLRVR